MRILLADDHEIVREGLRSLLAGSDHQIVGDAQDGESAIQTARTLGPDVVVMDVAMPGLRGIEAVRRIVADSDGQVKVLILSMYADRETICDAFRAGASGYIVKSSAFRELLQALEDVAVGKTYLSPTIADVVIEHFVRGGGQAAAADDLLTPRQKQIVQMVAEGYSAKRIATALDINHKTVHALRAQIMARIKAKSIVDLVKYALRHRLTELR